MSHLNKRKQVNARKGHNVFVLIPCLFKAIPTETAMEYWALQSPSGCFQTISSKYREKSSFIIYIFFSPFKQELEEMH